MLELRPRQVAAIEGLKGSLRAGKKRPIIMAPTGFGKTVLGARIVSGARAKGKRVAFAVPSISLVDQTFDRFVENGIEPGDMGIMQGNHPWHRPFAPIQICSIQTVGARGFPEVDAVIVDEVHIRHKTTDEWLAARPNTPFIGLSATPWSKGLADHWDDLIIPATLKELIDEGWASKFKAFAPSHPDLAGITIVGGDYHQGQLSERLRKPTIVGDVVTTWMEKAEGLPTLVFAVDRAHAMQLHQQFSAEGIDSAYVDAETKREERITLGKRLNAGTLTVICSVGTMTHGVDLDIRCVVLARPTKSEILLVQMIGRGLRMADGKDHCLVLDHSDSMLTLGLPTDINHDKLRCGGQAKVVEKPPTSKKPRECRQCQALIPPMVRVCFECGYDPVPECNVTAKPGKLISFAEAFDEQMRKPKKDRRWSETTRAQFYSQLAAYAIERGFKPGWAAFQFKEMFGEWPNQHDQRGKAASACGPAVKSWIKSQMIRKAKAKSRPIAVAAE